MSWVFIILLALTIFAFMAIALKVERKAYAILGLTMVLGLAGYALQAHPNLAGSPHTPTEPASNPEEIDAIATQAMAGRDISQRESWLIIAGALARHGRYGDAATVLRGAIKNNPNNGEAWFLLAESLVNHAEGQLTPAANFAFERAIAISPEQPAPLFFLGMAQAGSGDLADAHKSWSTLLSKTPPDAPWRDDLVKRLQQLDQFLAKQQESGGPR